ATTARHGVQVLADNRGICLPIAVADIELRSTFEVIAESLSRQEVRRHVALQHPGTPCNVAYSPCNESPIFSKKRCNLCCSNHFHRCMSCLHMPATNPYHATPYPTNTPPRNAGSVGSRGLRPGFGATSGSGRATESFVEPVSTMKSGSENANIEPS